MTRVLLDTHAYLWFELADPKLSAAARQVIADPAVVKLVSPATWWEVAVKVSIGKYALAGTLSAFFGDTMRANGFVPLPIEPRHADVLAGLPLHHRDPFDRMLIAQAISEKIPIISGDAAFDAYPVTRIW